MSNKLNSTALRIDSVLAKNLAKRHKILSNCYNLYVTALILLLVFTLLRNIADAKPSY